MMGSAGTYGGWLAAVVGITVATLAWSGETSPSSAPPEDPAPSRNEVRELRRALERTRAESAALREELDRLVSNATADGAHTEARHVEEESPDPEQSLSSPRNRSALRETAEKYQEAVSRALAGDEAAREEAYGAAMRLIRSGAEGFPALREAYRSASDPEVRAVMLRSIIHGPGSEAEEFVAQELRHETDPDLRQALAERAAHMATPNDAPVFRDVFLDAVRTASQAETAAAAVRGLRHLRDDPEVDQALLAAADDRDPEVRLAAVHALASRPSMKDELKRMTERETDPEVREVAQCRLLLSNR